MIPSYVLQLVEAHPFGGAFDEDPNNHIKRFVRLCDTFDLEGVSEDVKRMRLVPFSLVDEATGWLRIRSLHWFIHNKSYMMHLFRGFSHLKKLLSLRMSCWLLGKMNGSHLRRLGCASKEW